MSSTYSGGHSRVASVRAMSGVIPYNPKWSVHSDGGASHIAMSTSPRASSTVPDDLDLDSFFKRLDKYTAEMEEVEARLRQDRTASKTSFNSTLKRFSLELDEIFDRTRQRIRHSKSRSPSGLSVGSEYSVDESDSKMVPLRRSGGRDESPMGHTKSARASTHSLARSSNGLQKAPIEPVDDHVQGLRSKRVDIRLQQASPKTSDAGSTTSEQDQTEVVENPESTTSDAEVPEPPARLHPLTDEMNPDSLSKESAEPYEAHINEGRSDEDDFEDSDEPGPSVPNSWILPPRMSSRKLHSEVSPPAEVLPPRADRNSSDDVLGQEDVVVIRRQRNGSAARRPKSRYAGVWSPPNISFPADEDMPPVPPLSESASTVTSKTSPPPTPVATGSLCSPNEDQLRRELETFALHDGAKLLPEVKYKKRRPPRLDLVDSDDETRLHPHTPMDTDHFFGDGGQQPEYAAVKPRVRRKKSIFTFFERRSPVEKLIDMYFDDDEVESKSLTRHFSLKSRKSFSTTAGSPRSPPVPPMPQTPLLPPMPTT